MKPAVKRSIAHNMGIRHKLQDVARFWEKLVAAAEDGEIATEEIFVAVNEALALQTAKLQEIVAAVDNE